MFQSDGKFQAHSGRTVRVGGDGTVMFDKANGYLSPESAMDAEEFFQAKRDRELGRWRSPLFPGYLVYPDSLNTNPPLGAIRVWNETNGVSRRYLNRDGVDGQGGTFDDVAAAYFESHPVRKPWDDAKPGDIWVLSIEGEESFAVHATEGFFGEVVFKTITGTNVNMQSSVLSGARRIWPEGAS